MTIYENNKQLLTTIGGNADNYSTDFEVRKAILDELGGNSSMCSNIYEVDLHILKIFQEGGGAGCDITLTPITITENGVYTPDEGGYNEVIVDVACDEVQLGQLVVSENGNYYPIDYEVNGFDLVTVEVPETPLTNITITENGVYTPSDGGYSEVTVAVEAGSNVNKLKVERIKITDNCLENGTWVGSEDLYNNIDKTYLTDFSEMFSNCKILKSLDLSGLDTSNVKNMSTMFGYCSTLQSLNLSGWDTSNVTSMNRMFSNCEHLYLLNLSGWVTSNVTSMERMFYNCDHPFFETLDLSGWDTSNVTSMERMFGLCHFNSLNLSGWNISEGAYLYCMFEHNPGLVSLDLSGWKFLGGYADTDGIFSDCNRLTTLIGGKTINEVLSKNISTFIGYNISIDNIWHLELDRASLRAIINGIADLTGSTSQTISLSSDQIAKLTTEDIAVATAKNWTIA